MASPLGPATALALSRPAEAALGLGAVFVVAGLAAWLLYRRGGAVRPRRQPMSFLDHLDELGKRLGRVLLLFLFWSTAFLMLRFEAVAWGRLRLPAPVLDVFDNAAARLYVLIAHGTLPEGVDLIVSRPTEAVGAQLQVAFLLGFALTLPALLYEAWAFFSPGLRPRERVFLARSLPWSLALFAVGAAFAYAFIVPLLLDVFYRFAAPLGAIQYLTAGALVGTVVTFAFLFGLAFQLPLVLVVLVRLGVARPAMYVRYGRHVTVAVFIVAAVLTDPTIVSQFLVASILLVLYWGGVAVSYLVQPVAAAPEAPGRERTPVA